MCDLAPIRGRHRKKKYIKGYRASRESFWLDDHIKKHHRENSTSSSNTKATTLKWSPESLEVFMMNNGEFTKGEIKKYIRKFHTTSENPRMCGRWDYSLKRKKSNRRLKAITREKSYSNSFHTDDHHLIFGKKQKWQPFHKIHTCEVCQNETKESGLTSRPCSKYICKKCNDRMFIDGPLCWFCRRSCCRFTPD